MIHQCKVEVLEYHTFQAMADPVELHSVLHIEHFWGEFRASELQETFHGFHMYYHIG